MAALGLAFAFEVSGLWFSAEVFTGIVHTTSDSKMGIGALWPTPENLGLVYDRLAEIAFPGAASACYTVSVISRVVAVGGLLRLPCRGQVFVAQSPAAWEEKGNAGRKSGSLIGLSLSIAPATPEKEENGP